jgi:hypothetical protein
MEIQKQAPAFMRVIADIDLHKSYNKYLVRPLVPGELVKVVANQDPASDLDKAVFRKHYVRVARKATDGTWSDIFVTTWDTLEPLKKTS